jgi:hypothetical protein
MRIWRSLPRLKYLTAARQDGPPELARYDFKIVYHPENLTGMPEALSRRPEYPPEKGDRGENVLQLISLHLKPVCFISEMMLEDSGVRTVISGSKLYVVSPLKFDAELMECVLTLTTNDQE